MHKPEESRDKKEHSSYILTFFGVGLAAVVCFVLLFAGIGTASAAEEPSFHRMTYVNEWGGALDSPEKIEGIMQDAEYMNCDAVMIIAFSDYWEAVRNPDLYGDWDPNAAWDMVGVAIEKAHARNIQLHVWIPITRANSPNRAERRFWGNEYDLVYRDGYVSEDRFDLAFEEPFNYEIGLMTFIASHHPDLDGIHIEEPGYSDYTRNWNNWHPYTTAMRNRIEAKYGYDPLYEPEEDMKPIIDAEVRAVLEEFFTELRISVKAANPDIQLSVSGGYYPFRGLYPQDMQYLLDWYGAQIYRTNINDFKTGVETLDNLVTEIPICPTAAITYTTISPEVNPAFFEQVERTYEFGGDIVGIYNWWNRYKEIPGTGMTAMEGLHNIEPPPPANGTISGSLSGTVANTTGAAIQGARVTEGTRSDTTNETGNYTIAKVPAGTYTVTAAATGYENKSKPAKVTRDKTTTLDFQLVSVKDEVLVYPNPYIKGQDEAKIRFDKLPDQSTIKIYTISGDLVKTIEHQGTTGGKIEEWDISGIAGGVYVYSIDSPSTRQKGEISIIK